MIYFNKFIPYFLSPLFLCSILICISLFWKARSLGVLGLALLMLLSTPVASNFLTGILEKDFPPNRVSSLNPANKVVVLGGMLQVVDFGADEIDYEILEAFDRFEAGLSVLSAQKASQIVFTRGFLPWSKGQPEGEVLLELALKRGVPISKIILTRTVQNTDDEAKAVRELLIAGEKIILVTSSFHMPRAMAVFRAQGISVIPHAVDFRKIESRLSVLDFIPSAGALNVSTLFFREMLGRAYYKIKY
jgi:uncharacterized SAM-binding protein YcdF (DUF218 family)